MPDRRHPLQRGWRGGGGPELFFSSRRRKYGKELLAASLEEAA